MKLVNCSLDFPRIALRSPKASGYLLLAAEVDAHETFFFWESAGKKQLLKGVKQLVGALTGEPDIVSAQVFKAVVIPPGRGRFLEQRRDEAHVAKFDVVVLIETQSVDAAQRLRQGLLYRALEQRLEAGSSYLYTALASNIRRIDDVDHGRPGVFLFNFFFCDDKWQNLAIWEHTAGWFAAETGLDNSTVLAPIVQGPHDYGLINHCRWDGLTDIVPSLLLKPSFRSSVLDNFEANQVAAIPILYRLA